MRRALSPSGRKSLLLLAVVIAFIGGAWWWQRPPPEPVYHGKRLSQLLASRLKGGEFVLSPEDLAPFGPGTVPWLAYTAGHGRHPFTGRVPFQLDNAPDWVRRWLPEKWGGIGRSSARDERVLALLALQRLGPGAAPAIPTLVGIIERASHDDDVDFIEWVAETLNSTGPASWPVVEEILEHGNEHDRWWMFKTIDFRVGTIGKPVSEGEVAKIFAILMKAIESPDASVRAAAAEGLGSCSATRPDLFALHSFIDEVIPLLSDPDAWVRWRALEMLANGDSGAKGARAVPRLIELLDDPSLEVKSVAARALGKLDTTEKLSAVRLHAMVRDEPDDFSRDAAKDALKALGLSPEE